MNQIPPTELLSAYLDGEVTPEERASVEAMLVQSPKNRQLLADLKAQRHDLQSLPRLTLPDGFADRVVRLAERRVLESKSPVVSSNGPWKTLRSPELLPGAPLVPVSSPDVVPEIVIEPRTLDHGKAREAAGRGRWQVWQFAVGFAVSAAVLIAAFKVWSPVDDDDSRLANSNKAVAGDPAPAPPAAPPRIETNESNVAHFDWGATGNSEARPDKTPAPQLAHDRPANNLTPTPERVAASDTVKNSVTEPKSPSAAVASNGNAAAPSAADNRSAVIIAFVGKAADAASQAAAVERFEKFLKERQVALTPAAKRVVDGVAANRNNVNPRDRSVAGEKSEAPAAGNSHERAYVIEGTPSELQAALQLFKSLTGDADSKLTVEPLGKGQVSVPHENLSYGAPASDAGADTRRALFIFRLEVR